MQVSSFCSDGSLSTKQILFLQRPILQRKRKDFKVCSPLSYILTINLSLVSVVPLGYVIICHRRCHLKSHVTKSGMYSKYKPTQEQSNNRLIVTLKVYRKEASMKEALLWFVRCLERLKEKRKKNRTQNCLKHICLISDAEPQGSQQGKEKLNWRRGEREQVPLDGDRDGQVEEKCKRKERGE